MSLGLGAAEDIRWVRDRLLAHFGDTGPILLRSPIGQLVKSSISSRTLDAVSLRAYDRLVAAYPRWSDIAAADTAAIEAVIADVTFAEVKAPSLRGALRAVAADRPDFDLTFLRGHGVPRALAWLERLPGVGRKVSASTLNFSWLGMPALVIDTHVLRVLRRYGFVRAAADTRAAYDRMMPVLHDFSAAGLAELHLLLKHLGQTLCRADHACCGACPLGRRCRASAPR
ncbi:endonuclease III domain-containing protein [Sandaracinobacteroides saxicola]|nr:endonuclease III [Sandaracinobacteroides saxicola]